jgi:hypothetical protein
MQAAEVEADVGQNDPAIETLGEGLSVWEAATAGREIILDGVTVHANADAALVAQQQKVDESLRASKAKGANKKGAFTPYEPKTMEVRSGVQPAHKGELDQYDKILKAKLLAELKQRFKDNVPLGSPFPHLTPGCKERPEHVTSSRVVGASGDGRYVIHERFHQDQGPRVGSKPSHDRFFATDGSGVTYSVKPAFSDPDKHELKKLYDATVDASRSAGTRPLLNSTVHRLVNWEVDGRAIDTTPPLSPRSQRRQLPDLGYGLPSTKHGKK